MCGCLKRKNGAKVNPPRRKLVLQPPTLEGKILLYEDEGRQGSVYSMSPRVQQRVKQGLSHRVWGVARWPSLPHGGGARWGI